MIWFIVIIFIIINAATFMYITISYRNRLVYWST